MALHHQQATWLGCIRRGWMEMNWMQEADWGTKEVGRIGYDRAGYDTAASRLHFTNFVVDDNDVGQPFVVVWVHISSSLAYVSSYWDGLGCFLFSSLCAYCLFCVSSVALLFSAFSVAVITDGLIEFDGWRNGSAMHSGIWASWTWTLVFELMDGEGELPDWEETERIRLITTYMRFCYRVQSVSSLIEICLAWF